MSNAMRFGKRSLAGVAAGALALGMLTIASAPAASAKPSIKPKAVVTASVSPVRVSFAGTALEQVPYSRISWTSSFELAAADTVVVTLAAAPTPTAQINVADFNQVGQPVASSANSFTGGDDTLNLATKKTSTGTINIGASGFTGRFAIAANTAGAYGGAIQIFDGGVLTDTATWSFTTTGRATSMAVTPATQSIAVGGVAELEATLKDASGNTTQPLSVDSVTWSGAGGTFDDTVFTADDSVSGFALGAGTVLWTNAGAGGTYAVTATPSGTLPSGGVTAQTAAVSVSGTVTDDSVASLIISSPTTSTPAGTQPSTTVNVPNGTTQLTIAVTGRTGQAGRTFNFQAVSNRDTAAVPTSGLPIYATTTLDANLKGTITFNLAGGATTAGAILTITQVKANLTPTSNGVQLVATVVNPEVVPASITTVPAGSIVAQLGTTTSVSVRVTDQFGAPSVGAVVRAFRTSTGGTLLSTGTTNATGVATVTVSGSTGITSGTVESYVFTAQPIGVLSQVQAANPLAVTYTTSGAVTAVSVNVVSNTGATTPISNTTTGVNLIPLITTPFGGVADTNGGAASVWNVATGAVATGGALSGNRVQFTATPSPANTVTVTTPEGVFVSDSGTSASKLAWNAGTRSVTIASGQNVWVFATKTGTHEVSFTSGAVTTKVQIRVNAVPESAYNIAVSPTSRTLEAGAFGTVTLTVSDVFGNPVPGTTTGTPSLTGGVTGVATGEVLLSGLSATGNFGTGTAGTAAITLIGGKAGTGTVTFTPQSASTNLALAWRAGYVPPTGAPAPVTSAVATITVTAEADKSIVIVGERATVSGKPGIRIEGLTDGIEDGKTVTPFIRFPGETTFTAGSARPTISADEFTWQRKTGKRVTVYVELSDDASVRSNRVTIQAN